MIPPSSIVLRLDGLGLARGGRTLLARATLDLGRGQIAVVEGARGSGKSTLLAAAAGLLRPRAGAVWLGGRDLVVLQSTSLPYVRRNVGYLAAEPPLLRDETAVENVLLPLEARGEPVAAARLEARATLDALGLADAADVVVARLSTGARRLVALARALVGPPPLVVLDDPTAGLDPGDVERVAAALRHAQRAGAAILAATTDDRLVAAVAPLGARKVRIEGGRLVGATPAIALVDLAPEVPPAVARAAAPDDLEAPAGPFAERDADGYVDLAPRARRSGRT